MITNYTGAYVINLEENKDRKKTFLEEWNNIDHKISILKAIDTRLYLWKNYKHHLSRKAIKELKETIKNKKRKTHADLTEGAIGCYLSHLKCCKRFLRKSKSKDDYCLVLEDDSSVPKNLLETIADITKKINTKWGMILLGWIATSKYSSFNEDLVIPESYQLCHSYLLSNFGEKKILEIQKKTKIEMQIDHFMSKNIKEIKIFGTINNICIQKNHCGYTNIQNYPV